MAAAIARTAHGSGIAAASREARMALAAVLGRSATASRGTGGVSGPCHPARAGTNCAGACGCESKRWTSGRMGVACAGITTIAATQAAIRAITNDVFRMGLNTNTEHWMRIRAAWRAAVQQSSNLKLC
jgi:hypothetical protein